MGFMGLFPVVSIYGRGVDAFYLLGYSRAECIVTGVIAIIAALMGLISLIVIGWGIYAKKNKTTFIPITACILSLAYMILCLVVAEGIGTLGFIPFIIIVLMTVAYFICAKFLPQPDIISGGQKGTYKSSSISAQKSSIELIKEYKGLLDGGIITQEEFDAKEAKLLK